MDIPSRARSSTLPYPSALSQYSSQSTLSPLATLSPLSQQDDFYHWIEVFDRFDDIYVCYNKPDNAETDDKYILKVFDPKEKAALVIQVRVFFSSSFVLARSMLYHLASPAAATDRMFADPLLPCCASHIHIHIHILPLLQVLRVSAVVLETRVNKNLAQYNSLEHLHAMIASDDLLVVSGALEVLLSLGRHRNKLNTALEKDLQVRSNLPELCRWLACGAVLCATTPPPRHPRTAATDPRGSTYVVVPLSQTRR